MATHAPITGAPTRAPSTPDFRLELARSAPVPLLADIIAALRRHDMTASAFGVGALRDPNFVEDLRFGREPRRRTEAKARAFIALLDAQEGC